MVLGTAGRILQALSLTEFVHDAPFDDELGAPTVEYRGTETVAGAKCHRIFVDYGQRGRSSTWIRGPSRGGRLDIGLDYRHPGLQLHYLQLTPGPNDPGL